MLNNLYKSFFKRFFDFIVSLLGFIVLTPLFCLITFLILISGPGPVFFRQQRIGRLFVPFTLFKFRSMVVNAHKLGPGVTCGTDPRITRIGRFLRKTKLDELPQLLNVIIGDMALVGPRPELLQYINAYTEDYSAILSVRPGITDYAAIEFRDEESILNGYADKEIAYINIILPQKIKLYKKYLDNISLSTDFMLIVKTLERIVN